MYPVTMQSVENLHKIEDATFKVRETDEVASIPKFVKQKKLVAQTSTNSPQTLRRNKSNSRVGMRDEEIVKVVRL